MNYITHIIKELIEMFVIVVDGGVFFFEIM